MTLPSPNLDDRDFRALLADAMATLKRRCPDWDDLTPHDPGIVLLELFAHLTEVMIYRLNRVPEKVYVELLRLLGVCLAPPAAARATLRFASQQPLAVPARIPRGTRVTVARVGASGPAPVFTTDEDVVFAQATTEVDVVAHCCEFVEAELAGKATGAPGFWVQARHVPLIAATGGSRDLVVGVEAEPGELGAHESALKVGDRAFAVWREVASFAESRPNDRVYVADRVQGRITFAPAVRRRQTDGALGEHPQDLGAVPAGGREIRLWYRHGGGSAGNVTAGTLTVLKDPLPGLTVSNPRPAAGGRDVESMANALRRGPLEFRSLERAVTAEDFELLACRASGAVARAKAFTLARSADAAGPGAGLWVHAAAGTVEVTLVPALPPAQIESGVVKARDLIDRQDEATRQRIHAALDACRPVGTRLCVSWTPLKTLAVKARVVVHREEEPEQVRRRVLDRLHRTINPLASDAAHGGWPFGRPLHTTTAFEAVLAEPGVSRVEDVRLLLAEAPSGPVRAVVHDGFQPRTLFAVTDARLFRSTNGGDGWERVARFEGEELRVIACHSMRAGRVAVVGAHAAGARVHLSEDCGETWLPPFAFDFAVNGAAWTLRDDTALLLLATDKGLYELAVRAEASPLKVLIDEADEDLGLTAVVATEMARGEITVAVGAQQTRGVFVSAKGGGPGTFRSVGPQAETGKTLAVQGLAVQRDGPRTFLWAGFAAEGDSDEGQGCKRFELSRTTAGAADWESRLLGWRGGTCRALAIGRDSVWAATHRAGVLRLAATQVDAAWQPAKIDCGLPLRDVGRLQPVDAVACDHSGKFVIAGGPVGLFRSTDGGVAYQDCSQRESRERVTIPPNWLLCSGDHQIEVVSEDHQELS